MKKSLEIQAESFLAIAWREDAREAHKKLRGIEDAERERITPELEKAGYLESDRAALDTYLQHFAMATYAYERIQAEGIVHETKNHFTQASPWLAIHTKQSELLSRWARALGIGATNRTAKSGGEGKTKNTDMSQYE